jgi:Ni,Fe-hydrogenase I small subunit
MEHRGSEVKTYRACSVRRYSQTSTYVWPIQEGAAATACRRHGLEVEDEGLLKDLVVIFVFLRMLCTVRCFF